MKIESQMFVLIAVFLYVTGIVYGVWSREPVGTVGLVLSGTFCLMIGGYCGFIARRIDDRPEDRGDAEVADGAGELGFFSPRSYWPFTMGLCVFVFAIGAAFWQAWVMMLGGVLLIFAVGGLLFEYYIGQNRPTA